MRDHSVSIETPKKVHPAMLEVDYGAIPDYTIDDLHRAVTSEVPVNKGTYHNWIKRACHEEEHDEARLEIKSRLQKLNMTQAVGSRYKRDDIANAAWVMSMELFPPDIYRQEGKKKSEKEEEADEIVPTTGLVERSEICVIDDVIWVYENMHIKEADKSELCPGPGAYGLLEWARKNVDAFYKTMAIKALTIREREVAEEETGERLLRDSESYREFHAYLKHIAAGVPEPASG